MNRNVYKSSIFRLVLTISCVLVFSFSFAGKYTLNSNGNAVDILENTYEKLRISSSVSDINTYEVKTSAGTFSMLTADNYGYSMVIGSPQLPVFKQLIEIPFDCDIQVNVLRQTVKTYTFEQLGLTYPIMPSQPPVSKSIDDPSSVAFIWNQPVYEVNSFLANELVSVENIGEMRGIRMARLEIAPFTYNPGMGLISVVEDMEFEIVFSGANISQTIDQKETLFNHYFSGIQNQLFNYKPVEKDGLIGGTPVTYIIVSAPTFHDALQPFIEWKTKKGFHVYEAYTNDPNVGTTTTSIKNFLKNFYLNPPAGYTAQSFVLFVGDVAQIPAFNGSAGSHVTDLYYCEYTNDRIPECFYGRFSANNLTELQPQIDKTLEYEQYLMPDPSFLGEVVMVTGADGSHQMTWGNGQINYGTNYYFNAAHNITSHTYLQPLPSGAAAQIRQDVSNGASYANYTAHCSPDGWADPSFVISHVAQMTNANKYPLMVGNCCSSVEFQTTCFGEVLLRAANKGALGYIGGSNSTYWDEDYWWGVGFKAISANPTYNVQTLGAYDRTFHDGAGITMADWYVTQGQMVVAGNLAVEQSSTSMKLYYWEIYHLMGDPSVMIYLGVPPASSTNFTPLMPLGSATFTVNTDPYAFVAISKEGVLHGTALADENGVAVVTMDPVINVPGYADVVVTRQNTQPYIGQVLVASPEGPFLLLNNKIMHDDTGNNNGSCDFGETITVDAELKNLGNSAALNVTASLGMQTPGYITINQASNNWGTIPAQDSVMVMGAFEFTVDEFVPDQYPVQFTVNITDDNSDTWSSSFICKINAPVLEVGNLIINDASGNNNGRLDPGETVQIKVATSNTGHADAANTTAVLSSADPMVTIVSGNYNLNTLTPGASAEAIFSITISPDATVGSVVQLNYLATSGVYTAATQFLPNVGLVLEDFESGNFEAFDWEMGGNLPWGITNASPYEGTYSAKSGTISHDQNSEMSVTFNVLSDSEISFYYKVSSESNYDFLKFYIDDVEQGSWSGTVNWTLGTYDVTAGDHTFRWVYEKDYSVSSGSDAAWIDYIIFPPVAQPAGPLTVQVMASPNAICEGFSSQLTATPAGGTGPFTYVWTPATGLNNSTIANPVATPVATTTYTVMVSDNTNQATGMVTVTVNATPITPAISQILDALVSNAMSGNQWYDDNGMIAGATNSVYYPLVTGNYYVIVTSEFGCVSEPSNSIYFVPTGILELSGDDALNIYPNPAMTETTVAYKIKAAGEVSISVVNSSGQKVLNIEQASNKNAGTHTVTFNASQLQSGIYQIWFETERAVIKKKLIVTH